MSYTIWLILGFLCLIGEIFTTDFSLSCVGISAFVAGAFSYMDTSIYWQLGAMGISVLILFATLRPIALRYFFKNKQPVASAVDSLIGKTFKVIEVKVAVEPLDS